jgi:threonine dehydratase
LLHLYASILEANRVLDRFRPHLGQVASTGPQAPLTPLSPSTTTPHLFYKREDLTVTRAYKVRGAVVGMAKVMEQQEKKHFLAVSTGNHALGVLEAAHLLRPHGVRIVIPANTAPTKQDKLTSRIHTLQEAGIQAQLVFAGNTFDEARDWALTQRQPHEYYLDPYSDPWVVAGQGTIGLELLQQLAPLLEQHPPQHIHVIAPVGGGGLLAGTATALKLGAAWDPRFRSTTLSFMGLRLADLNAPLGDAIRVRAMASTNQQMLSHLQVRTSPLKDSEMRLGQQVVAQDLGVVVEGASAGTVVPVLTQPEYHPTDHRWVVCLLSGGNVSPPLE